MFELYLGEDSKRVKMLLWAFLRSHTERDQWWFETSIDGESVVGGRITYADLHLIIIAKVIQIC